MSATVTPGKLLTLVLKTLLSVHSLMFESMQSPVINVVS